MKKYLLGRNFLLCHLTIHKVIIIKIVISSKGAFNCFVIHPFLKNISIMAYKFNYNKVYKNKESVGVK